MRGPFDISFGMIDGPGKHRSHPITCTIRGGIEINCPPTLISSHGRLNGVPELIGAIFHGGDSQTPDIDSGFRTTRPEDFEFCFCY